MQSKIKRISEMRIKPNQLVEGYWILLYYFSIGLSIMLPHSVHDPS